MKLTYYRKIFKFHYIRIDIPSNWKMLLKKYKILVPFLSWKLLTFKQVKVLSRNRSDNYIHTALKQFVKEGILNQEKIGNVIQYSISKNEFALNTVGYVAEYITHWQRELPHQNIQKLISKIKTPFYSLLITGSYAKNKQRKNSDLDIVIICDDQRRPNTILSQIKTESELLVPEVHPMIFTKSEFLQMLLNKEENYGKETVRNNLAVSGAKQFYSILIEASENGFRS